MNAGRSLTILALAALAGCASTPPQPGPAYPDAPSQQRTIDIQVLRDVRTITLTNTTADDLPPGRMWVNKWFSREVPEGLAVAQTAAYDLGDFVDEFGERFRAGGFFATEDPEDLVLAQYETTNEAGDPVMYGFIVVNGEAE